MNLYYYPEQIEAGVDEVARGCLLGRMYSAAVIWSNEDNEITRHPLIKDSKKLDKRKRLIMSDYIKEHAIAYSISYQESDVIDKINILNATFKCMHLAIDNLNIDVDNLLVDGNKFKPYISLSGELIPHQCIIGGDNSYYPIACASILAAATGVPGSSPIIFAILSVKPPALHPRFIISLSILSLITLVV